jgi:RimJ/RimL family protein N-acetyltransferase
MASAGSAIFVTPFSPGAAALFADFDCGSSRWAMQAAEWIKGPGAVRSLQRGNAVLTYHDANGDLVGFGSIGKTKWMIDGASVELSYLSMFAISIRFQGARAEGGGKYSALVLQDLIDRASHHNLRLLGLHCHPDNGPAKQLYLKFGFVELESRDRHGNLLMIRKI